jgi:hypothetical protein
MSFLWIVAAAVVGLLGLRYRSSIRGLREPRDDVPAVDDAAVRSIVQTGRLSTGEPEALDMDHAARAEEEFWAEYWDEPEEYHP